MKTHSTTSQINSLVPNYSEVYHELIAVLFTNQTPAWPKNADPDFESYFFESSRQHAVLPLIHEKIFCCTQKLNWPEFLISRIREAAQADAVFDMLREQELCLVLDHFKQDEIPVLLLKGAALAYGYYASPHLRPRSDTDIFIEEKDLKKAEAVFTELGYLRENSMIGTAVSHQATWSKEGIQGGAYIFDLHIKLCNPQVFSDSLSFKEMILESARIKIGKAEYAIPSLRHALLHACMHLTSHHHNEEKLIWLYDIDLLARSLRNSGLTSFADFAAQKKMSAVCDAGFRSARKWFSTPAPANGFIAKNRMECSSGFLKIKPKLAEIASYNLKHASWPGKFRLLKDYLFPPPAFLLAKYGRHSFLWVPLLYLARLFSALLRPLRRLK